MFYIRTAVCRYVEVLSGQIKTLEKLQNTDLDEARVRSTEAIFSNLEQTEASSKLELCKSKMPAQICQYFQPDIKLSSTEG